MIRSIQLLVDTPSLYELKCLSSKINYEAKTISECQQIAKVAFGTIIDKLNELSLFNKTFKV